MTGDGDKSDEAVLKMPEVSRIIEQRLVSTLNEVSALVPLVKRVLMSAAAEPDPRAALRDALESACHSLLEPESSAFTGVGFVAEAGQLIQNEAWMTWWVKREGVIKLKHHVLNPESDSFYDYSHSEWFQEPRRTRKSFVAAPYIDSWGTDELTMTASLPIEDGGEFLGVAAGDLGVRRFADQLSTTLLPLGQAAVVNRENQIIASTVPVLTSGLRLTPYLKRSGKKVIHRYQCHVNNWQIVLLDPT